MSRIFKFARQILFVSMALGFLVGCTGKNQESKTPSPAKRQLNLAIWNNYLSPGMQKKFTDQTGIEVKISNYSSNEELLAKIQSGASDIDVAVPSDYMVNIMIKTNLIQTLDAVQIPNKSNIDPKWLNLSYDPQNKFSYPYAWTVTGIAFNKRLVKTAPKSWKELFEKPEYGGQLSLLDDVREVMGAALKMQGYSYNSVNPAELAKAARALTKAKSRVKMFRSDVAEALANKEVAVAQAFSSDALLAMMKNPDIDFVFPTEGSTHGIDNLVIFKNAKNLKESYELINFLLTPEIDAEFVTKTRGGPVMIGTKALLPEELKNSKVLYPSDQQMKALERIQDLGNETKLYDDLWTQIKTGD